ncbi:hypothetical protein AOQ84DRAFT_33975 [Glonium stellatum]|uniref:Uncharacterized protein n=1 Tax=Glonium stellatum TaxID=574774 RepID=A0A8E2F1Y5_9PEZI|nr:hypothetical protein AOQ84DRAFT_33975 [Glonium stellatum]
MIISSEVGVTLTLLLTTYVSLYDTRYPKTKALNIDTRYPKTKALNIHPLMAALRVTELVRLLRSMRLTSITPETRARFSRSHVPLPLA